MKIFTIPNFLTFIRLIFSPLMLPILLVYLIPYNVLWINILLGFIFIGFSLTDFFDRYLARELEQETKIGRLLDPLANKFLVDSTLIALLAVHKIYFYWVIILIGRALLVMGIRLAALEKGFSIKVSFWGKINTVVQIVYLTVIIANPYQNLGLKNSWNKLELGLLFLVLVLTIVSAEKYLDLFIKKLNEINVGEKSSESDI